MNLHPELVGPQAPLRAGPFEQDLLFPQGLDLLHDPLTVDWDAMLNGDMLTVADVVEAWRVAHENGHICGPVHPYDRFQVRKDDGTWGNAIHIDRNTVYAEGRRFQHNQGDIQWRD